MVFVGVTVFPSAKSDGATFLGPICLEDGYPNSDHPLSHAIC